jgi:hypothetical protein
MEDYERKLKLAGFRSRRDHRRANAKPVNSKRKAARAKRVALKLKKMGLDGAVCLGCGSSDLSEFEFDHIAGKNYDQTVWPLCEKCHEEKTYMLYLDPPQTENPNNVFAIMARWLYSLRAYGETAIRFLQASVARLGYFADFLIDLARRGYGDELAFPS